MRVDGNLNMKVSFNEARLVQTLLEKHKAKPIRKYEYKTIEGFCYKCPRCNEVISDDANYCKSCGQRIDNQNVAF